MWRNDWTEETFDDQKKAENSVEPMINDCDFEMALQDITAGDILAELKAMNSPLLEKLHKIARQNLIDTFITKIETPS